MKNSSFVFWDHYKRPSDKTIGGIETLIINLIQFFSENNLQLKVKLISNFESIIYRICVENKFVFEHIHEEEDLNKKLLSDDVIISFGVFKDFNKVAKVNPKLLIWRVYPSLKINNWIQFLTFRQIFTTLHKRESLVFMDKHCLNVLNRELRLKIDGEILFIPIKEKVNIQFAPRIKQLKSQAKINISYIGRGTEIWKIKPLKKLVYDLSKVEDKSFTIHIFTDESSLFKEEIPGHCNIEIIYYFNYFGDKLVKALNEVSDIHFGMGTSSLEGSILGIPTIIADPSFNDLPENYRYRWIFDDIESYSGIFIDKYYKEFQGWGIVDILNELENEKLYLSISEWTQEVTLNNFAISKIANQLLEKDIKGRMLDLLNKTYFYWASKLSGSV